MTCIAIDDEPLALQLLEDNIRKVPFLQLVGSCRTAFEAMKVLQGQLVDLIFIDIQMPGLTGLQFIASLEHKPLVIFITAYKEFALESYELAVVDYLVKPVPLERFIKACLRAQELFELRNRKEAPLKTDPGYVFLPADYSQVKIMFDDIRYIEGVKDYVNIYLKSHPKPQLFRSTLKALEPELPSHRFIRIHKSYLVAIESITAIKKTSLFLGPQELPIGETYREAVVRFLHNRS